MKTVRPDPLITPPAWLRKWQVWTVGLVVMLVPFFVTIPTVLRRHPVISPLGDQLHIVLLAGITLLLYWRGPLSGRLWATALAAAVMGLAIEFIQIPCGRTAGVMDFVLDLVGIGLVVGYMLWRGQGLKLGLWLILTLLLVPVARLYHVPFVAAAAHRCQQIFPLISDLEGPRDHWIWNGNNALVSVVEVPDSPRGAGRVVRLESSPPARWPGAEMRRFPHDWSDYDTLAVDVRLVSGPAPTQRFSIRLDDYVGRKEKTWIVTPFTATREWQTFRIPFRDRRTTWGPEETDRVFDQSDVDRIIIYLPRPDAASVLEIDNLRLE